MAGVLQHDNCGIGRATSFICSASSFPEIYKLFRDTHDLVEMFLLFDRVEHERRHRFAGQTETHPGSGIFPTSMVV